MPTLDRDTSALLLIDFQARPMPAIADGAAALANARQLLDAAVMFGVPALITEENPAGLGGTAPELAEAGVPVFHKMSFDACRMPHFRAALPDRRDVVHISLNLSADVWMMERSISISTDVFAKIWALREDGENTEDDILRRLLAALPRRR